MQTHAVSQSSFDKLEEALKIVQLKQQQQLYSPPPVATDKLDHGELWIDEKPQGATPLPDLPLRAKTPMSSLSNQPRMATNQIQLTSPVLASLPQRSVQHHDLP